MILLVQNVGIFQYTALLLCRHEPAAANQSNMSRSLRILTLPVVRCMEDHTDNGLLVEGKVTRVITHKSVQARIKVRLQFTQPGKHG